MDTVFYTSFERAVIDLERAVCRDRSHVVLAASPGPGRAALTRELEERLSGSLRPLEIPVPTASRDEIRARIVHQLGGDPSVISEQRMVDLLREVAAGGSALLLLIRDADTMPAETLNWLGCLAAESGKGLRLVLVVTVKGGSKGDLIPGLIAALGAGAQKVVLEAPGESVGGPVSGSPSSSGSRDAALAHWAHPLRPRVQTLRELTVRPRDPRRSRWRGHATFAAAVALVALGVHHLAAVPLAPNLEASSPDQRAAKVLNAANALKVAKAGRAVKAAKVNAAEAAKLNVAEAAKLNVAEAAKLNVAEIENTAEPSGATRTQPAASPQVAMTPAAGQPKAVDSGDAREPSVAVRVMALDASKPGLAKAPRAAAAAEVGPEEVVATVEPAILRPGGAISPPAADAGREASPDASALPSATGEAPPPEPAVETAPGPAQPVAAVSLGVAAGAPLQPEAPSPAHNAPASSAIPDAGSPPEAPVAPSVGRETPASSAAAVAVSVNARPWARIQVDGRDVGITPLANLKMSPGPHRFQAHLSDGRVFERTVHVDEYRDRVSFP